MNHSRTLNVIDHHDDYFSQKGVSLKKDRVVPDTFVITITIINRCVL